MYQGQQNMQWYDFQDTHISTALVNNKKHKGHSDEMHNVLCWGDCEIYKTMESQSKTGRVLCNLIIPLEAPDYVTYGKCSSWHAMVIVKGGSSSSA